jgi:Uri superfamily endonuclease
MREPCTDPVYAGACLCRRATGAIGLLPLRRRPLHADLQIIGAFGAGEFCTMESQIPALPGAYLLLIELTKVTDVKLRKMPSASVAPGRYVYAGSAYGPGGLKARISRHMRRTKVQRWHIDQLTETGVRGVWIFPGCNECDLVDINSSLPVPIIGFGSTDRKRCHSHLLGPICYSSIDPHNIGQGCPPDRGFRYALRGRDLVRRKDDDNATPSQHRGPGQRGGGRDARARCSPRGSGDHVAVASQ